MFVGAFLAGFVARQWAFVVLVPLVVWIQRLSLEDDIKVWLSFLAAAALIGGVLLRWFATRRQP